MYFVIFLKSNPSFFHISFQQNYSRPKRNIYKVLIIKLSMRDSDSYADKLKNYERKIISASSTDAENIKEYFTNLGKYKGVVKKLNILNFKAKKAMDSGEDVFEGGKLYEQVRDLSLLAHEYHDKFLENENNATIAGKRRRTIMKEYDKLILEREGSGNVLEKIVNHRRQSRLVVPVAVVLSGLLFLSFGITGNAIANLTIKTSSIIGVGLFVLGVSGFYFYSKRK